MLFKRKGEKRAYRFVARECIGRACWAPGEYQHRGATLAGSRNTGSSSLCCMHNAYHGCPNSGDPDLIFNQDLAATRKAEGWKAQ